MVCEYASWSSVYSVDKKAPFTCFTSIVYQHFPDMDYHSYFIQNRSQDNDQNDINETEIKPPKNQTVATHPRVIVYMALRQTRPGANGLLLGALQVRSWTLYT